MREPYGIHASIIGTVSIVNSCAYNYHNHYGLASTFNQFGSHSLHRRMWVYLWFMGIADMPYWLMMLSNYFYKAIIHKIIFSPIGLRKIMFQEAKMSKDAYMNLQLKKLLC